MEVIERFVAGKYGDPELCEDAVFVSANHVAVVDGATDISDRRYDGASGGHWAMAACMDALSQIAADCDAQTAVTAMTQVLAARVDPSLLPADRPSASVGIFSIARRQVWQIGDVRFHYSGLPRDVGQPRKRVDQIASAFRAAIYAAEAAAGRTDGPDPARDAVRALVARQGAFRNQLGPYGYAGIDGRAVPPSFIVVHDVPDDVRELVLGSDGYPQLLATLAESETLLARLLIEDPLCVSALCSTKGMTDGQISYDDRAYIRIGI